MASLSPFLRLVVSGSFCAASIFLIGTGVTAMNRFAYTPGERGNPPVQWPPHSSIARLQDSPTLVMVLHPGCSCSRASLSELDKILTALPSKTSVSINLIVAPPTGMVGTEEDLTLSNLVSEVRNSTVVYDRQGTELHNFNVATSGHTLLYDAGGELVFSGGITKARGHEGQNTGALRLLSLLTEKSQERFEAPVFGCGMSSEGQR